MNDKIAETFGTESTEIERAPRIVSQVPATYDEFTKQLIEHRKSDYFTVRDNLINILKDMESVVDTAISGVQADPSARMIESFSTLVKTFSEVNKDLLSLTDKNGESKISLGDPTNHDSNPTNNIIFIGTSDALIDQIKANVI